MQTIPTEFKLHGMDYKLKKCEKDVAMYELWKKSATSGGYKVFGYEVHKVRKTLIVSRTKKHRSEILARDDFQDEQGNWICEFGQYGWAFKDLENAEKKFQELI